MIFTTIAKIFQLLEPRHKKRGAIVVLLLIISAILEIASIGMIFPLVSMMTTPEIVLDIPYISYLSFVQAPERSLFSILAALNFIFLIAISFRLYLSSYQAKFISNLKIYTSSKLLAIYLAKPWPFFLSKHSSLVIQNVLREVEMLSQYGYANIIILAKESIFLITITSMLLYASPIVTIISILLLTPLLIFFLGMSKKRIKLWSEHRTQLEENRLKELQECLSLAKEIKLSHTENEFLDRFLKQSGQICDVECKQSFFRQLSRPVFELYIVICVSSSIIIMWLSGMQMTAISPLLALFGIAMIRLLPSVNQILIAQHGIRYIGQTINIIHEALYSSINGYPTRDTCKVLFSNRVDLEDVSFSHENQHKYLLSNINMKINFNQIIGIIGPTGSGKSSLIDIISGLLIPTTGTIKVDGNDIRSCLNEWQSQIGYVGQNHILLDDTIRRNISLSFNDSRINDNEIWAALDLAHIGNLVRSFSDGLDTKIGERGSRLSGGERQRLCLARALFRKPRLLILDEATSALDEDSEDLILSTMVTLKKDLSIVLITHKLRGIKYCDSVYNISNGTLTEVSKEEVYSRTTLSP